MMMFKLLLYMYVCREKSKCGLCEFVPKKKSTLFLVRDYFGNLEGLESVRNITCSYTYINANKHQYYSKHYIIMVDATKPFLQKKKFQQIYQIKIQTFIQEKINQICQIQILLEGL